MKLRVRINRQTGRVELPGDEPSVAELREVVKQRLASSHALSSDTEFSLSLNGSEILSDSGQTLSSCGVVSGDLICVLLPRPPGAAMDAADVGATVASDSTPRSTNTITSSQTASQQSSSSSPAVLTDPSQTCGMPDPEPATPVWEPMLCSEADDGQAPLSLDLLYHGAQTTSPNDAVMVAAHLLMLETGFTSQDGELKPGEMPAGWRSAAGVYRLQYVHPLCCGSSTTVVGVAMGPLLVINTTLKVTQIIDTVRKLQLSASSYVTNEWPGGSAAAAFKDLKKLSRIFKDQLAYPLIAAAREAMALPVAFGLPALPPELLLRVLRLLDVRSVVHLSGVSRHFNAAAADSTLWRHLYLHDFTDCDRSRSRDTDWKELYKKSYKLRSDRQHARRHRSLPPYPPRDIFSPMPHRLFPPVPGIIGGEYDQRPNLPHGLLPLPRYDPISPITDRIRPPRSDFRRLTEGRSSNIRRGFI
ncbi:F-box only protein 7 [Xenentodon cancila]